MIEFSVCLFLGLHHRNVMFHVVCPKGPSWVIYTNDFTQSINLCKVVLYADVTILLFANKDPDIIKYTLETDLESAQHWFN